MARNTATVNKVSDAAADSLERAGIDPQRAAELAAATREQALALGQEAIERAGERREQVSEAVRNIIEQLPSVSVEVSQKKPGRLGSRRTGLVIVGLVLLALVGFAVAKRMRQRNADSA